MISRKGQSERACQEGPARKGQPGGDARRGNAAKMGYPRGGIQEGSLEGLPRLPGGGGQSILDCTES